MQTGVTFFGSRDQSEISGNLRDTPHVSSQVEKQGKKTEYVVAKCINSSKMVVLCCSWFVPVDDATTSQSLVRETPGAAALAPERAVMLGPDAEF